MDFEELAVAFSQEEWGLLDEAQRLMYCDVMLDVFVLVSSVGCGHKTDEEEACSDKCVSVSGEPQARASETAPDSLKRHLCKRCSSFLKNILHLTELQAAYFEQKAVFHDACVRGSCFVANPHQPLSEASGEKPWNEDLGRASFVTMCSFYLPWVASARSEVGKDFPAVSELLQHQVSLHTEEPHSGCEISQELLSRKRLPEGGESQKAADLNQRVVQREALCSGAVNYECNKCGKVFRGLFDLIQHQRVHTGEKPYECFDCGKSFSQRSQFNKHRSVHTGEKPYECFDCGKSFSQSFTLIQHHRVHTGEKPYVCTICGKSFSHSSTLTEHRRVHTGEKPYACTYCGKAFSQSFTLIEHHRVHTGEKPHECTLCGKSFSHYSTLIKHQRVHTGEKPYACSQCGKSFSLKFSLVRHLKVHTGEKALNVQRVFHLSHSE